MKDMGKRFRSVKSLKAYVSKALRELDDNPKAAAGDPDVARAKFQGARLMLEIIQSHTLVERVQALEAEKKERDEASATPAH